MNRKEIKRLFIRFLKEYNVYGLYVQRSHENLFDKSEFTRYISASKEIKGWAWNETNEGHTFWYKVNILWHIFILQHRDEFLTYYNKEIYIKNTRNSLIIIQDKLLRNELLLTDKKFLLNLINNVL